MLRDFCRRRMGTDLGDWQFLQEEANSQTRPNRVDWSFTWERKGFKAKEAPYRLEVGLTGNKIGEAQEFLQVPEAWTLGYKRLRNGNDTLAFVFAVPYFVLIGAAAWIAIVLSRKGQISWSLPIKVGMVVAVLMFLQSLNGWPLWAAQYRTTDSYVSFIASQIAFASIRGAGYSGTYGHTYSSGRGNSISRRATGPASTEQGLYAAWIEIQRVLLLSGSRGFDGCGAHRFHCGVLHDRQQSGRVGATGIKLREFSEYGFSMDQRSRYRYYSSDERGIPFRLFAIPFFARLTRFRWIAVFVPAFLWGFLHSNYPQEPAYIRGLEVGLIGIVAGYVILRWGIVATLTWHYTVDASLVGLLLIRSDSVYFRVSGIVVALAALVPLAYSGINYLRRGQFEAVDDLLNGAEPAPEIRIKTANGKCREKHR